MRTLVVGESPIKIYGRIHHPMIIPAVKWNAYVIGRNVQQFNPYAWLSSQHFLD